MVSYFVIFKKYTAYQKLYYYKLNKSIDDFIFNVKEKYSKINWKNLQNINQSFFDLSDVLELFEVENSLAYKSKKLANPIISLFTLAIA